MAEAARLRRVILRLAEPEMGTQRGVVPAGSEPVPLTAAAAGQGVASERIARIACDGGMWDSPFRSLSS